MAKDGTARGGARSGAGRKKENGNDGVKYSSDRPKTPRILTRKQQNKAGWQAKKIYERTWDFLERRGCSALVNPQLVEEFAMAAARWEQCEDIISAEGLTGKHPTTGAEIASPYVTMAQNYAKEKNAAWYQIEQIIKENSSDFGDGDDPMTALLS